MISLSLRRTLACTAALLLAAPAVDAQQYRAVVTPHRAQFVFPVPQNAVWEWQRPHTPNGHQEFAWTVADRATQSSFEFGFFRFQTMNTAGIFSGSLTHLLAAGQHSAFVAGRLDTAVHVVVRRETGQLVVELPDSASIARVLSTRPDSLLFRVTLGGTTTRARVPVDYVSPEPLEESLWIPGEHEAVADFRLPVLVRGDADREAGATRTLPGGGRQAALLFWEPQCEACVKELQAFDELARTRAERTVFYAITSADSSVAQAAVRKLGVRSVTVLKGAPRLGDSYAGAGVPYLVVLDAQRLIVERRFGSCPYAPPLPEQLARWLGDGR